MTLHLEILSAKITKSIDNKEFAMKFQRKSGELCSKTYISTAKDFVLLYPQESSSAVWQSD